jgi:hypothetical protein
VKRILRQSLLPLFLVLAIGATVAASDQAEVASRTGLAPDLFLTLTVNAGGRELALFLVYVDERAFQSKISPDLRQSLLPYVGRNALFINPTVEEVSPTLPFSPALLSVEQEGRTTFVPSSLDWVELSPGFLAGTAVVNPGGVTYGSGSSGILLLGDRIDPARPFTVVYAGAKGTFRLAQPPGAGASAPAAIPTSTVPPASVPAPLPEGTDTLSAELLQGDFSPASVAALLQLDPSLVGTIVQSSKGEELRLLLVRLEEGVRAGAFAPDLLARVEPYFGTGAVMVWALSAGGASFSPFKFYVQQKGTSYVFFLDSSFAELTEGFRRAGRVAPGEVAAGVLLLPGGVLRTAPFTVFYSGGTGAFFP